MADRKRCKDTERGTDRQTDRKKESGRESEKGRTGSEDKKSHKTI